MIKNYIGGRWTESLGKESVDIINPATEEILETCPLGLKADVDSAVGAAVEAFPGWRRTPTVERIQPLFRLKTLMEENFEDLAKCVTIEHGKTLVESRGSVRRAVQMVETATSMPTLMMGDVFEDIAPSIDCQSVRRPMGVFAGIAPFNFPAMVPFWFWPFAVASGNTFVLKPSERVPLTQMKVIELLEKAGLPSGVMNIVHGGKEVVDSLCSHPDIKGVSFVGSTPVAKHVYETATKHGKRAQSLGGAKNMMVVLPDAILEKAVQTSLESITGCAGERCLAGSIVTCVGDETYSKVQDHMVRLAKDISVGNGLDQNVQMGPVISDRAKDRIIGLIDKALEEGAELLLDGRGGPGHKKGYYISPTVLGNIKPEMEIAKTEVFGPVVLLSKVKNLDEAISWINSSNFGNTTTLFTTNGASARKFSYEVEPSMIGINIGVPAPMSYFTFGGSKDSFFGDVKAHGSASVNFYTDTKVTIKRWLADSNIW
jgi:malonate-semialdehyde dehydrogenase (acetylating) / methylmalonate-semialdehyde dehydrogenase